MVLGVGALLEGSLHTCWIVSVIHAGQSITAAASNHHPEMVPAFAPGYNERTVLWEKLAAWVWHIHNSSPFPLSPATSRDAYCRSYYQVMQQRTCGCAQRCSRSPEKFGTKRRGSRKPYDLWICEWKTFVCVRERERECLLLQLL